MRTDDPEPAGGEDAVPGASRSEILWEQYAEAAQAAFEAGRIDEAGSLWRAGSDLVDGLDPDDPRRAASLSHAGVVCRAEGAFEAAVALYRLSVGAWEGASAWIARMKTEQRARSSLFHLRLEEKYRKQYVRLARASYRRLADGGLAASLNNLAEVLDAAARREEAEPLYRRALKLRAHGFSPREEGAVRIIRNLAGLREALGDRAEAAELRTRADAIGTESVTFGRARFAAEGTDELTDVRRLKAAVFLTPLLSRSG